MAILSIMALYDYDNTIFDSMYTPVGVNKQTLINDIMLETAELECVYPTPVFLKTAIGLWSSVQAMTWDRVYRASQEEYNPIENYDRNETETVTGAESHSGTDTTTISGTGSGSDSTSVAGFDSSTLVPRDSTTFSNTNSGSEAMAHGERIDDTHTRTSRIHGNIGVTTSQQMLEQEMQIAGKLNIYNYIVNEFKQRFCIAVY